MKKFKVSVRKLTDTQIMREACECTFNGKSHQSLRSIYCSEHSPARTQMFWIRLENIPLFVATHLIRHHVGSTPFQLTCREDRDGGNQDFQGRINTLTSQIEELHNLWASASSYSTFIYDRFQKIQQEMNDIKENCDRQTPVTLGLCLNAQSLIDMAKVRLCKQAHPTTREIFSKIKLAIIEHDPELAAMMVPKCIYRGGVCGEPKCCKWNRTLEWEQQFAQYMKHFN